jgi:anti-sigma regulatory factor (Ser/Thr protein kinase)
MDSTTCFSLDFHPAMRLVSRTRQYLDAFYGELLSDPDETYRLTLTVHELLENLVKYSVESRSQLLVGLREDAGQTYARVETRNSSSPQRIADLQQLLEGFSTAPDAITAYDALLASSIDRDGSGLGLARIRAEAGMRLECDISGNEVTIRAEIPVYSQSSRLPKC